MTDGIRQFKINGKQVEFSNDKKSASRDLYAQDAQLNSIFEKLNKADANGNIDDILDEKEIKDFQQKIIDAAGEDGDLSSEETKSLLDSMGLKEIDTNKFFGFIQSMFSKEDAKVKEEVSDAAEQPQTGEDSEEEQITRGIIVQNGESPAAIAKKFGVPLQDLLDANKDALKGKGDKKYFLVGQEIVIPRKIDDDELATLNAGRKSAEETTGDYAQQAAIREQKAAEVRARKAQEEAELKELGMTERAKGEVKAHYSKTPDKTITFKKVANAKNGRSICVDKNGNYVVVAKDGTILKTDFVKNPEKYEQARKLNEEVKTRNTAKGIAKEFYQIADDNSGLNSIHKMQKLLDTKVTSKNITQFLDEYDKFKQDDSSIIDTITSEVGASGTIQQKKVLTTLMDKLSQAARAAGVSEAEIKKANADFLNAYNAEYKSMGGSFRRTNPKDMEKAMDSLRGNILAKQNGTGDVDSAEAIKQFKDLARNEHNSAVKDFNKAREEEGWTAKVGDTVCGWFGCNTIEDLNKKLGANGAAVKKLINSKTEAEFRTNYKEIFGVEFDPNKISARQNAIEKYSFALNCDNTVKAADKVLKHSDSWGYSDIKTAIRNNFKYDNATIDQIIEGYAQAKDIQNPTDADKKTILVQFLNDTKTNARREFTNIAQGKSLDQMGKDIELITRSAFGTNDIVKDVIQFNENQQITEMVTEAGFEIAGTIALQFVPGLGQMAAARLAVSAARWGTKAVKVVRYAQKAEKVFSTVNKFQKGEAIANATTRTARVVNRGVQIGAQMVNTGVATAGVDLSNGKSVKETTKKALMNMSFAGVGASSSILAPKLMSAFGIADKALATEIAEEIINAAGSYGVTKLEGGEYGSTDAFVDFASGLIISRISHVKSSTKPQGATTPDVPTAPKVDTPATPAPKTKSQKAKADVKPAETPEVVIKPNPETKSEPVVATSKEVISDEVIPNPVKTVDETPVTPTPKKEVAIDEVAPTPVKTSDEVPPSPVKVDDKVPTPEVETPVTPQPKYTKEFEPAHNDIPVYPEVIDQRLGADNHELKDMGEYYRDLETKEFEPHYEKREVSAKTIDEQFENPELKKLNEEFASGNSMLQKQAAVESAIENLNHQNYSPEYVESIREKIKEISVDNPEMEKSYNELLDMAANDASTERASLIREKEYIERTYGIHKSAQESAEIFSDHLEQVNATKEDDYIRRTHQNPSGKSAAESAEVFEKELAVRDKVKATDEQLHQKTVLDGDELFERVTHSNNPELQKLGARYKKLEAQQEELQQQVERLKEQIRRKAQTSASEIDGRFNRSNPELDIMNTKYRSLELQQEKLRAQVEKLKQQMREKVSVSADDIDSRLNQRTGDYEDLATDLRNREAAGQRAKKELELERAEQAAVEREQAYIDRTHGTRKSASESADVFKADIAQKEAAAKAKEEAKLRKQQQMQVAIYEQAISDIYDSRNLKDLQKIQKRISSITDPVKRAEVQKQLDEAKNFFKTNKVATKGYLKNYNEAAVQYENGTYSQYLLKNELENMMKNQAYRKPEDLHIDETVFLNPLFKFLKKHPGFDLSDTTQLSKLSIKEQRELTDALILAKANGKKLKDFDDTFGTELYYDGAYNAVGTMKKNITPDIPVKPQHVIDSFNNDLDILITDIKAKKGITDVSVSIKEIIENGGFKISDENITKLNDVVNNPKFGNLSAEDKKLVMMATLLQDSKNIASQTDTVFDVYNVASKLGMTRQNADKLLNITKGGSFVTDFMKTNKSEKLVTTVTRGDAVLSQERKDLVIEFAWDLKDGNNYELAKMIYQAGEPDGLTRNIDKVIEKEIQRLREKQLVMPQTSQAEIMAHTQMMTIGGVEVPVVKASDIPGFRTFTHSPGGTTNHQHIDSAIQNLEVFGKLGDEHNVCACYVGGDNLRFYGLDGYAFMMDVDPNKILTGYVRDLNSSAKTKSQAIAEFFSGAGGINQRTAEFLPELICDGLGISKEEYGKRIHVLKQKCGSDFSIKNMKKYDKELAEVLENGMLDDNAKWTDKRDKTKELFFNRTYNSHNEYDVYNPTIKGIVTTDPPRVDHRALLYAKEHNLPIVILNDAKLDYVKNTVENLNMDNLSSVNIEELKVKINQLEMPFSSIYTRELNDKLTKLNPTITVEQAKLQCSDDKLIELATTKDGKVQKEALDVAMKYKELAGCNNDDIEFLLEQCNGNYKKVNDLMNKIQSELDRLDLEIRHGEIGIKGLKLGEFPDMDNQQFMKKYGSALNRGNKLINGCYRIDDLMHFYLFGKGKYIDSFNSGNIMKDLDIAYGCRSVTDGYHVRYTNILEKEDDIATLMAHSLSSQPTPDQRYALGRYKGDMSESIQEGHLPQDANDIDEYLSSNPLKKSIKVKREDSYAILSNLKFADGVTLKDAITNPQYHDRLSQIKSLEGQSFINDRFMSTTVGDGAFGNSNVNWDLEVSEGVGATYLDILGLASEGELLLNRGLKVTITEIDNTTPNGIVHIKAKVEKAD